MRKVLLPTFMTLDGVAEFPEAIDNSGVTDPGAGPAMWKTMLDSTDTLLLGRTTYELWADFWPGQKESPTASPFEKRFSRYADSVEKVVFSKTLESAKWPKSRIVKGDLTDEITRLKSLPGKDLVVGGGPKFAQSILDRDLADELFVTIFPCIAGGGKPFFHVNSDPDHKGDVIPHGAPGRRDLKLLDFQAEEDGAFLLHYARASSTKP
jgi:dihydrofolate reductase